ncbi:uncharacterized protein TNCV_76101 [Trichonephila clavipes]|nr:uncharacterized protein TNCV_76101 [Trichonephila clavipes]
MKLLLDTHQISSARSSCVSPCAFADDLAVVTTGGARRTLEIETNSILDQIFNKLKNLKLVISPEKTYSVAFRGIMSGKCTPTDPKLGLRPDHFAKVATANGVEVSAAPRSYAIKTLQIKLIEDWESWWSNSNTGLRVKSFFPKPSLDINPHSSYVTQFLTNHGPFVSY